jgi:hypothetical protein
MELVGRLRAIMVDNVAKWIKYWCIYIQFWMRLKRFGID